MNIENINDSDLTEDYKKLLTSLPSEPDTRQKSSSRVDLNQANSSFIQKIQAISRGSSSLQQNIEKILRTGLPDNDLFMLYVKQTKEEIELRKTALESNDPNSTEKTELELAIAQLKLRIDTITKLIELKS